MALSRLFKSLCVATLAAFVCGCGANLTHPAVPAGSQDWQMRPPAAGLQDIYNFQGSPDGQEPAAVIIHPKTAWPIAVTKTGGGFNDDGAVVQFRKKLPGKWSESVLYNFKGYEYGDGSEPVAADTDPYKDPETALFITAASGGTTNNGALVQLSATSSGPWTESYIYSFGGTPDGAAPWGAVVGDPAGNLYGTTQDGGAYYNGTVYRMAPKGSSFGESVLYSFGGGSYDGAHPLGGLVIDKTGALYGTTQEGGYAGAGTVFKLMPYGSGYTESILHTFQGTPDGSRPEAGLAESLEHARDYFYGTTVYGGTNNEGTVYRLAPNGKGYTETVLWNFGSVSGDGAYPTGGVCVSPKGVIVGTTLGGGYGGSSGLGTFFTLTPAGSSYKETVLYSFTGANGAYPFAGPAIDPKGNLYVTTEQGGTKNAGILAHGTTFKGSAKVPFCSH